MYDFPGQRSLRIERGSVRILAGRGGSLRVRVRVRARVRVRDGVRVTVRIAF